MVAYQGEQCKKIKAVLWVFLLLVNTRCCAVHQAEIISKANACSAYQLISQLIMKYFTNRTQTLKSTIYATNKCRENGIPNLGVHEINLEKGKVLTKFQHVG